MYFEQIKTPGLGCFSYILGCPRARQMVVVDPRRDVGAYIEISHKHNMKITHIFDTHLHADHVSGASELSHATGAPIFMHENAPVEFAHEKLKNNDLFEMGGFRLEILHTPGHTPNSISILVTDLSRSSVPAILLSGDLLFVGDAGRPDLPGEDILDEQIENLHNSLYHTLKGLPDGLEIYPAHGQGSLCGRGISAKPHSTLGYERAANPVLQLAGYQEFKKNIMSNLPMRPQSFSHIIATNMKGAPLLPSCEKENMALPPAKVQNAIENGAVLLDLRNALAFSAAHIPGSVNVPSEAPQAINWIGISVKPGSKLVLVADSPAEFSRMKTELLRIGYDDVLGYLHGGIGAWIEEGGKIDSTPIISHNALKEEISSARPPRIVDVRSEADYRKNPSPNSAYLSFDQIIKGGHSLNPDADKVIVCNSGYRSAIAVSLLKAQGQKNLRLLAGGIALLNEK